ncbi:hypothetical protein SpCBS45565_g01568 [Spizellomyces sp. 'palustris']|nr:hypothetical protein SpCBS45565_g01568 [Spizellomyces sp. 'palustris']
MSSFLRQRSIYATEDRIVLDIGSIYIKCGFSNEPQPRHILPACTPIAYADSTEGCRIGGKLEPLWDLNITPTELGYMRRRLSQVLRDAYYRYLLTDPKHRKVILCESPLLPLPIKQTIADILFTELEIPSLTFVPSPLAALLTVGKLTGLVIDCGNLETSIVPIYEGRPLIYYIESLPLAGRSITERLKLLVKHHGRLLQHEDAESDVLLREDLLESLALDVWEEIKAQMCFVGDRPSATDIVDGTTSRTTAGEYTHTQYRSSAASMVHRINVTDRMWIPGWVRERAAEVLFEGDDDARSIATIVADVMLKCPADIRTELAQTILLNGGTSMLPGFQQRLQEEIMHAFEDLKQYQKLRRLAIKVKIVQSVFAPNSMAWVGGSLAGALKVGGKEILPTAPSIPDWTHLPIGAEAER